MQSDGYRPPDGNRQWQEEGKTLLPGLRAEAGDPQAAGAEPDRHPAIGDRPACRRADRRVVPIDLPIVRDKVYGVQGGWPMRLSARLSSVSRAADAAPGAHPSRLQARRQ